jgi:hypothetical protein
VKSRSRCSTRRSARRGFRASATAETFLRDRCERRARPRHVRGAAPPRRPWNDNLMELLIMCDALRRASAASHHRGDPLLRLRPPGPGRSRRGRRSPRSSWPNLLVGGGGDARRGARPCTPAQDPGLLQHPVRFTCTRCPCSSRTNLKAAFQLGRGLRLARRRRPWSAPRALFEAARRPTLAIIDKRTVIRPKARARSCT